VACGLRIGRLLGFLDKESVTPNKKNPARHVAATNAILILGGLGIAFAAPEPRSFVASPDIYKAVAQNDPYLVIEVTWKPGQRDLFHAHPVAGVYRLTDCELRAYPTPDGFQLASPRMGSSSVNRAIDSHSLESIGKYDCQMLMFDPKSADQTSVCTGQERQG
jgi:hypothetical protein